MHTTEQIGSLIAELRTERGLKQNQLSAMLNMSQGNLSNYEHGVYGPALDSLCKLADFFNVSTDFLLGRTSYRCPPEAFIENLTSHYTMSHVINILMDLDTSSQDAAVKYIEFLRNTKKRSKL